MTTGGESSKVFSSLRVRQAEDDEAGWERQQKDFRAGKLEGYGRAADVVAVWQR